MRFLINLIPGNMRFDFLSIRFLPMIGLLATGMASCFIVRPGSPEEAASPQPVERDSFSSLHSQFAFPGKEYGSAPLWVWNTEVTTELIDTMMHAFSQNAFGGVFIHPRPGLVTEYLSDEWFRLVARSEERRVGEECRAVWARRTTTKKSEYG